MVLLPALFLALACVAAGADANWTLQLLSDPMAVCLDGSPAGYYVGPAAAQPDRFIIHLQGGGWCTSFDDCAARAGTHYGSSAGWTRSGACPDSSNPACWGDSPSGSPDGLQSLDPAASPEFAAAVHIYAAYCDGASFSGALLAPHAYNASLALHFRGRFILDAIIADLAQRHGLARARDVLLKGCSAGGMAVYLHADYVGQRLAAIAPAARFAAAPGAGMFLDQNAFGQNASFSALLRWSWAAQNASGSTNAACEAAHAADAHLCYLAPHVLPYVQTPLFIANSLTDSCALGFLMELGCDPRAARNCSAAQLAYVSSYRAAMLAVVRPALAANARHGAYLQACWTHIVEDDAVSWSDTRVEGQSQRDTFSAWWRRDGSRKTVVVDGELGENPTCSNLGGCD